MEAKRFQNVDEYLSSLSPQVRSILQKLRQTIKKAAPGAEEVISYNMPAFKFHGMLVYFSAFKEHYSLFPFKSAITAFRDRLKSYELSKGTIRLPLTTPVPVKLVTDIIKFRVNENLEKEAKKKLSKKKVGAG